jgi:hypothetical protein
MRTQTQAAVVVALLRLQVAASHQNQRPKEMIQTLIDKCVNLFELKKYF